MADWVHVCPWCGWARASESATMLEPRCEQCGGLLEARTAGPFGPGDDPVVLSPRSLPHLSPAFGRVLRFALIGLLLFAAARFGWSVGGLGLSLAAIGVVGLFTVPLMVD